MHCPEAQARGQGRGAGARITGEEGCAATGQVGPRRAEKALADAEARHRAEDQRLVEKEAQLARERRELDRAHQVELDRLRRVAEKAERDYRRAMAKWKG
jgi:hypothetical protein